MIFMKVEHSPKVFILGKIDDIGNWMFTLATMQNWAEYCKYQVLQSMPYYAISIPVGTN